MTERPPAAVFLSYASQDTESARRMAEALRAAGIEVWFDQDELRGGDEWDRKIKKQIRESALFVPVISANTQARSEGYFRLEWHLAEQRSLLIAKGRAYIVPVCVDETPEAEALVPDAFLAVQWSRPSSEAKLAQFVAQVQRLLAAGAAPAGSRPSGRADRMPAPPHASERPVIPDYELLRQIGRGSYGDVWLARGATGVWRAIKIVWRERFADAEPFEREWRGLKEFAAISLGESAQMALLHVGRNDEAGFFYYVMELADDAERGRGIEPASYVPLTLTQLRARRPRLPAAECVRYGAELARVLAGLHRRGLVHRDIKPSNVILVEGVPKLADIGLVAPTASARTFVGTEGFVPPEGPGAPGADVFALGKVLYELATGLDRQQFPQLPPDLDRLPDHRELLALNEVILRACEPSPDKRYRDAAALLADLSALQAGRSVRRARRWPSIALATAAGLLIATGVWLVARRPATPAAAPGASVAPGPGKSAEERAAAVVAKPRGIAVLLFANLDAADQAFFAAGVTEEVTQHLAKIRALRVMSAAAVARFIGGAAELPAMTRELGIGALLTGSVRRAGDLVRISVQLLAAPSGETLWAEQYDRPASDIFAVQSDVAKRVASALQTSLAPQERARIERPPTTDTEGYALYLQAEGTRTSEQRIGLLKRAVALDPKFALAYCALSWTYVRRAATTGRGDLDRALEAARMAVSLDPQLARAHYELGNALAGIGQTDAARLSHLRAIELNPSFSVAFNDLSALEGNAGKLDQSFYWAKRSFPLAPNIAYTWYHVAGSLMMLDEASGERWLRAGIARFAADDQTGVFRLQILLACIEFSRGQSAAAMERMRKLAVDWPNNPEVRTVLTELAVYTGAADAAKRVDQALRVGPGAHSGLLAYSPRALRAFLWTQAGNRAQARPLIDAALAENRSAIAAGDRNNSLPHENAALHLMLGDRTAACEALEAAVKSGFLDVGLLKVNPLLAPLADEPRFRQVVDGIERNLREMRARVELGDLDELIKNSQR